MANEGIKTVTTLPYGFRNLWCPVAILALLATPTFASDWNFTWRVSVGTLSVGTGLDIASSWGHREANPLLRGADGCFRSQGAIIKIGTIGGILAGEHWLSRRYSGDHRLRKVLAITNFVATGVTTGVAVQNWRKK